ncbi:hypothetical protein J2Z77_006727 [Streptomyces avidinii]|uniref:Uncharacterized protein n=1 Tax=Streptomyces avidinii TaxID=1895 RepID=A0ABS4LFF7_STRAV|nr:hypothetical protein [Streptomyces avidinii]MBP2040870.1 hypothetical protein [Streptomyces avidinii]
MTEVVGAASEHLPPIGGAGGEDGAVAAVIQDRRGGRSLIPAEPLPGNALNWAAENRGRLSQQCGHDPPTRSGASGTTGFSPALTSPCAAASPDCPPPMTTASTHSTTTPGIR